ncbi:MAG: hypothetical protein WBA76_14235 [Phormidesmis sp.]
MTDFITGLIQRAAGQALAFSPDISSTYPWRSIYLPSVASVWQAGTLSAALEPPASYSLISQPLNAQRLNQSPNQSPHQSPHQSPNKSFDLQPADSQLLKAQTNNLQTTDLPTPNAQKIDAPPIHLSSIDAQPNNAQLTSAQSATPQQIDSQHFDAPVVDSSNLYSQSGSARSDSARSDSARSDTRSERSPANDLPLIGSQSADFSRVDASSLSHSDKLVPSQQDPVQADPTGADIIQRRDLPSELAQSISPQASYFPDDWQAREQADRLTASMPSEATLSQRDRPSPADSAAPAEPNLPLYSPNNSPNITATTAPIKIEQSIPARFSGQVADAAQISPSTTLESVFGSTPQQQAPILPNVAQPPIYNHLPSDCRQNQRFSPLDSATTNNNFESPPVRVTIGRIEVKVTTPDPTPKPTRSQQQQTTLSLQDYLQQREGKPL